jgi:hypothetical protein
MTKKGYKLFKYILLLKIAAATRIGVYYKNVTILKTLRTHSSLIIIESYCIAQNETSNHRKAYKCLQRKLL